MTDEELDRVITAAARRWTMSADAEERWRRVLRREDAAAVMAAVHQLARDPDVRLLPSAVFVRMTADEIVAASGRQAGMSAEEGLAASRRALRERRR